ncbi:hypothetical protein AB0912_06585 [Streptomyces sp. NPDC007084]|uniref:hypothetical protein n=1 Tax=Streptomyces sp. NPDC007084 TaxID=3154313 RepID=UPI0034518CA0
MSPAASCHPGPPHPPRGRHAEGPLKALVLGGGAVALYALGRHLAGIVLGVVVVANTAIAETVRRTPPGRVRP